MNAPYENYLDAWRACMRLNLDPHTCIHKAGHSCWMVAA
jgi:hypothetical protein